MELIYSLIAKIPDSAPKIIFSGGVVIAGIILLLWGLRELSRSKKTFGWLPTQGEVIQSEIIEREVEVHRKGSLSPSYEKIHTPVVRYSYSHMGQAYSYGQLRIGDSVNATTEENVTRYPIGTKVTVFIDPEKPSESVILRGTSNATYFGLCLALVTLATGIWLFWGFIIPVSTKQSIMQYLAP